MDLVFHIGLPKTGTTTIQEHFLSGLPGYLGKDKNNRSILDKGEIEKFRKWAAWHRYFPKDDVKKLTGNFVKHLGDHKTRNKQLSRLIMSDEGLCQWGSANAGYDYCVTYDRWPVGSKPKKQGKRERPIPFAQFISDHFKQAWEPYGDVHIVVTLRKQPDYLGSLYAQRSRLRRNASQKDFESQVDEILDKGEPSIDWNALVEDLEEAVGPNNLTVLFFEEMGQPSFWEDIGAALDIQLPPPQNLLEKQPPRENVRSTGNSSWNLRPSKFGPHAVIRDNWPSNIPGKRLAVGGTRRILDPLINPFMERHRGDQIHMTEELRARIREHCAASNQRLAHRLNRDLESLGY